MRKTAATEAPSMGWRISDVEIFLPIFDTSTLLELKTDYSEVDPGGLGGRTSRSWEPTAPGPARPPLFWDTMMKNHPTTPQPEELSSNETATASAESWSSPLFLAESSSFCFGAALLVWGLTPAVVERLVTLQPPDTETLAVGSISLILGAAFLWLPFMARRGARWALWSLHISSVLFLIVATVYAISDGGRASAFPVILAACTMATTWLAIRAKSIPSAMVPITLRAPKPPPPRQWTI